MQSPFKLFEPYGTHDKHLFFGRDAEVYALYNLLQQTRLVLVYGASGTGKTSLLQAGLPKVFKLSDWFRISVRRRDDLNASLRAELERLGEGAPVTDLAAGVEAVYDTRWIPLYLVFDQFEELFTLGHHEERVQFFRDLQTLLERPLPCKIVLSMREEYIGHLYEYEPLVPALFDKRFRVEPMKDETVRQVVVRTCAAHGVALAEGSATAGQILEQVKEGKQAAHLPYLQVYLHYLYEHALQTTGQPRFEAEGIRAVGQLGNVLKRFIETQLDDARRHFAAEGLPEDFATRLLDEFATSEGTKQAQRAAELAQTLGAPSDTVAAALAWFTEKKLLRADENDVTRYEPVHDVVAKQIHELRTAEDKEFKAFVRQLENDCARWLADGESEERLLKEDDLAKVELYLERLMRRSAYTAEWRDFVARSRAYLGAQAQRRRRRQQVTVGAAVVGFLLAGLATVFYVQAKQQQKAADAARIEADISKDIAEGKTKLALESDNLMRLAKDTALLAKANTEKALTELKITSDQAVTILLAEIDQNILRLEYDSTFEKCRTALNLKAQRTAVEKRILEIAYFYTEADTLAAAIRTLNLLQATGLGEKTPGAQAKLRGLIKAASPPAWYVWLKERYFPKMVRVEGGSFLREGSVQVTVSAFQIAETETTVWQYFLFQKATHHDVPETPSWQWWGDNPIIDVSWYDAILYANWVSAHFQRKPVYALSKIEGSGFEVDSIDYKTGGCRLPTEAEWEFAARGGNKSKGFKYSGDATLEKVGWFYKNSNSRTQGVRRKKANELGLYDMSGNVWEWCNDWRDAYDPKDTENPHGPDEGSRRVFRGGSWSRDADGCRVAIRDGGSPDSRFDSLGFRLVFVP